jgi:putative transposase
VSGYSDHAHCLISLGTSQTISDVAKLIKGESSFWINKNHLVKGKFAWQDDFWVVSVSESQVKAVRNYIQRQEEKHKKSQFSQEIDELMVKYGWKLVKDNL